jgi:ATP-dependent Lhr-like helicase
LQAAATDDAIVLSLGTQHSFPLEEVFRYLNSKTVRDLLTQALLDAPMFPIRWRWNAARALALPRQRGGRKIPAPLQRMESENLLAAIFPDQLACLENINGDREIPAHPLVQQTIEDCLSEAMDIDGLIHLLEQIECGTVELVARDLPEPSLLAHEILNAKPYAFLDNAPLEERRTQAVYTRRASETTHEAGLGILDAAAIEKVCDEAWPRATSPDELHEALLLACALTDDEVRKLGDDSISWIGLLAAGKRAGKLESPNAFWVAAERLAMLQTVYPGCDVQPHLNVPHQFAEDGAFQSRENAVRELVRGRLEVLGPVTAGALANFFRLPSGEIERALLALEGEGFILRGKFHPGATDTEWCDRRLLARIHRLTINRLRAEIQPVSVAEYQRFLLAWQRVDAEHRAEGVDGVRGVLELFDGYELPASAWEPEVLALRVKGYTPAWLDQLCFTGRIGWGRLTLPQSSTGRPLIPVRSSPVSLFSRENLPIWLMLSGTPEFAEFSPDTRQTFEVLSKSGALFFSEIVRQTGLLPSRVERALAELTAWGCVTADSFEGLRALLVPEEKRAPFGTTERHRRNRTVTSVEFAGRWSLLRMPQPKDLETQKPVIAGREEAIEAFARMLLRRYGVVSRRILERESLSASWFELIRVYRRLEARGEIRGGYFVSGLSGEQYAMPEAIGLLRSIRKMAPKGELIAISGADPLNLAGILTSGPRVAAITAHRILLRDGVPVAALKAGQVFSLEHQSEEQDRVIERAIRVGSMQPALRPYYA